MATEAPRRNDGVQNTAKHSSQDKGNKGNANLNNNNDNKVNPPPSNNDNKYTNNKDKDKGNCDRQDKTNPQPPQAPQPPTNNYSKKVHQTTSNPNNPDETVEVAVKIKEVPPPDPELLSQVGCRCLVVDLPGVLLENLKVTYKHGYVRVEGKRTVGRVKSFRKRLAINYDQIVTKMLSAYFCQGVLQIVAPTKAAVSMAGAAIVASQLLKKQWMSSQPKLLTQHPASAMATSSDTAHANNKGEAWESADYPDDETSFTDWGANVADSIERDPTEFAFIMMESTFQPCYYSFAPTTHHNPTTMMTGGMTASTRKARPAYSEEEEEKKEEMADDDYDTMEEPGPLPLPKPSPGGAASAFEPYVSPSNKNLPSEISGSNMEPEYQPNSVSMGEPILAGSNVMSALVLSAENIGSNVDELMPNSKPGQPTIETESQPPILAQVEETLNIETSGKNNKVEKAREIVARMKNTKTNKAPNVAADRDVEASPSNTNTTDTLTELGPSSRWSDDSLCEEEEEEEEEEGATTTYSSVTPMDVSQETTPIVQPNLEVMALEMELEMDDSFLWPIEEEDDEAIMDSPARNKGSASVKAHRPLTVIQFDDLWEDDDPSLLSNVSCMKVDKPMIPHEDELLSPPRQSSDHRLKTELEPHPYWRSAPFLPTHHIDKCIHRRSVSAPQTTTFSSISWKEYEEGRGANNHVGPSSARTAGVLSPSILRQRDHNDGTSVASSRGGIRKTVSWADEI